MRSFGIEINNYIKRIDVKQMGKEKINYSSKNLDRHKIIWKYKKYKMVIKQKLIIES